MIKQQYCNLQQAQAGPLKLTASSLINLFPGKKKHEPNVFKGHLEITNQGKGLVAFKIMSKRKTKLNVRPAHGFIEIGETVVLDVTAKNVLNTDYKINQKLSILILATTCAVIDDGVPTDLRSFWNSVINEESRAFVEAIEIHRFHFYTTYDGLITTTDVETEENEPSSLNYFQQSTLKRGDNQEGSDASGDCSSHSFRVRQDGNSARPTRCVSEMKKLSNKLIKRQKRRRKLSFFIFCFLFLFLPSLLRELKQVPFGIVANSKRLLNKVPDT